MGSQVVEYKPSLPPRSRLLALPLSQRPLLSSHGSAYFVDPLIYVQPFITAVIKLGASFSSTPTTLGPPPLVGVRDQRRRLSYLLPMEREAPPSPSKRAGEDERERESARRGRHRYTPENQEPPFPPIAPDVLPSLLPLSLPSHLRVRRQACPLWGLSLIHI